MSQEKSYRKIVAQAKALMTTGNVTAYIKELVKAQQAKTVQRA
ncbi:MAG TPA: hypothetical protein VJ894_05145 [Cryomorphaceae bacterium]|nr:hypothetical protein [Cryomorphaceae bacterium]